MTSWIHHVDILQVITGSAILAVAWFFIRTLKQIDSNQKETARQLAGLSKEFYQLKGQHDALMCSHKGI